MLNFCSSANRCDLPSCEACAWRYSLRISRRITKHAPRQIFAVTIAANLADTTQFSYWRKAARNLFDYRRRSSNWWRSTGMWLWLSRDSSVRGILTLGALTEDEFITVFDRRWPTTIQPIEVKLLREHIYYAMGPAVVAVARPGQRRYQPIGAALEPQARSGRHRSPIGQAVLLPPRWNEGLPILL